MQIKICPQMSIDTKFDLFSLKRMALMVHAQCFHMTLLRVLGGGWVPSTNFLGYFSFPDILVFWAYMRAVIYDIFFYQ